MSAAGEDFWEEIATQAIDVPQDRAGDVTPTPPPKPPGLKERRGAARADRINARAGRQQQRQTGQAERRVRPRMIAGAALGLVLVLLIAASLTGTPQQADLPAAAKPVIAVKTEPRPVPPAKERRATPVRAATKPKAAPKPQPAPAPAAPPEPPAPAAAASQPAAGSCDFVPTC